MVVKPSKVGAFDHVCVFESRIDAAKSLQTMPDVPPKEETRCRAHRTHAKVSAAIVFRYILTHTLEYSPGTLAHQETVDDRVEPTRTTLL